MSSRVPRDGRRKVVAARARALRAGYAQAARLERVELTVAGDEVLGSMVDSLAQSDRLVNRMAAERVEQVYRILKYTETHIRVTTSHGMRPWSQAVTARRTAVSEVALALRIPDVSAQALIEEARMLCERLPLTLAGLSAGDFSYRHAKAVVAHARTLPDELHAVFEEAVVGSASTLTFSRFDRRARTVRERMDPATITQRHQRSFADREVSFEPAAEGMGWLHLYSSATVTLGVFTRADEIARDLARTPGGVEGETRTLTQIRADVVADLLLEGRVGDGPEFGIRPTVTVTVPALTLLGVTDRTGNLELPVLNGYGPIDVDTATRLAGSATSWLRVLTHPDTGVPLSMGTTRYKVPAPLRAFLAHRDGTCRKPGCGRAAARCDLDHTQEWQHGGHTAHTNLAHLCPMHHNEKHHTAVTVEQLPNGDLTWTLPSGHTYISEPENRYLSIHDLDLRDHGIPDPYQNDNPDNDTPEHNAA